MEALQMNQVTDTFEVLTVEQLATMLGITDRTVYRKCDDKELPFFRVGKTGPIRFLKSSIMQWIEEQQKS